MVLIKTLQNGLTLLIEEMPGIESVAYELSFPGGVVLDQEGEIGASLVLGELCSRGAGPYDSRAISEAFDEAGINHGEGADSDRFSFRGACLNEKLSEALRLVSLMVMEPRLPDEELPGIQSIFLQDISSLDDNPSRKVMVELFSKYFPKPYSRPSMGTKQGIEGVNLAQMRSLCEKLFRPKNAVLSIAGRIEADAVVQLAEKYFSSWQGAGPTLPAFSGVAPFAAHHIQTDSSQLQIALAFPGPRFGDASYYPAKVAANILSGGMFGRLFIEVREKRGLCYSVYLRHSSNEHVGTVMLYAGTTPERAHDTLSVAVAELKRLKGTATEEEVLRAKANIKASLIIGEESSSSRVGSNTADWRYLKRIRSMEEILSEIDKVQQADIDTYLEKFPTNSFFLTTLGARDITKEMAV